MAENHGKITINADEILEKHGHWSSGEASDGSNAGKRREAIGAYAEKCGIENKAFSQFRAGMKIKNDGKRKDWLRSLELLLAVAEREIFANEPDLGLSNPNEAAQAKAVEAATEEGNRIAEEHGVGGDDNDVQPEDDQDPDAELEEEQEEFDAAADEALGDETIVPFSPAETPIDFGGETG
jgi:hypothetical protein